MTEIRKEVMDIISDRTFLALIMSQSEQGDSFRTAYGIQGCQDLRRDGLYTWMRDAIAADRKKDIDFLEIMVSVVLQLKDDGLIKF